MDWTMDWNMDSILDSFTSQGLDQEQCLGTGEPTAAAGRSPATGAWQLNITGVLHCQHRRDAGAMQYARPCFGAIYGVCSQTLVVIVVMFIVVMLSCLGGGGGGGGGREYNYVVSHESEKLALSTTEQPKLYVG